MAVRRLVKPRLRRGHYADEVMETQRREDARRETGEFFVRLAADVDSWGKPSTHRVHDP